MLCVCVCVWVCVCVCVRAWGGVGGDTHTHATLFHCRVTEKSTTSCKHQQNNRTFLYPPTTYTYRILMVPMKKEPPLFEKHVILPA